MLVLLVDGLKRSFQAALGSWPITLTSIRNAGPRQWLSVKKWYGPTRTFILGYEQVFFGWFRRFRLSVYVASPPRYVKSCICRPTSTWFDWLYRAKSSVDNPTVYIYTLKRLYYTIYWTTTNIIYQIWSDVIVRMYYILSLTYFFFYTSYSCKQYSGVNTSIR